MTAAVALLGCRSQPRASSQPSVPYVVVLGTSQDAGLPQIGSSSANSLRAQREPGFARLVASLLVVDPRSGQRWLIDATPDLRDQVELASGHPPNRSARGPRPPLFEGIFLTHAHMGHYAGLLQLGREAYGASAVPVYASQRMCEYLAANGPWELLVRLGNIEPRPIAPDASLRLTSELTITPIAVPHRGEYTDTLGFIIAGPSRSLLYIPDIDKWDRWDRRIEDVLRPVDIALIDGTFFADGEISGRSMADIPHPFISESIDRFRPLPESERAKIVFTHLNHTNAAADPDGPAAARVTGAGMAIAHDGQVIGL